MTRGDHLARWPTDEDGHLIDASQWTKAFATEVARQQGMHLTEDHWWMIEWVRSYHQNYGNPPLMRTVVAAYREHKKDPSLGSASLYSLFADHPIRQACQLAGLPKPDWCL